MKLEPFWTDELQGPKFDQPTDLPERLDVGVVGGGYTGLTAALTLARSGLSVALFDRGQIGRGASSVNGGQLGPGLKRSPKWLFDTYGEGMGRELWCASVEAVGTVETLIRNEGIACDYTPNGSISLAFRPSHFRRQVETAEWMEKRLGYQKGVVSKQELGPEIGSTVFHGGLTEARGGGINPARFASGLAEAAARRGVLLFQDTEVTALEPVPSNGVNLRVGSRAVRAEQVLIATNGYPIDVVPGLRRRVFPIGSYQITTEPLPPSLQSELSPRGRMFFDTRRFLNYFRLTPDGRLAFGGRNDLSTNFSLEHSARNLRKEMVRIFPQLLTSKITHSWGGIMGFTFDRLPHIGRTGNVMYALGYNGHGVALAAHLGQDAARMLVGAVASPFSKIGHPTSWFYRKRPWFLPLLRYTWRSLDYWN
jgi:glycine/D-amino acid oxidase-like deaminating enzyme